VASRVVKGGPALTEYLNAAKSSERLYGDVQKHVLDTASKPSGRRLDVMHPSEMIKPTWCHLAAFHRLKNNLENAERGRTTFTRENIFQEGHQTHDKWQTWLADMNRLAGDWHCLNCDQVFWDDERPEQCHLCSANRRCLKYAEVPLNAEAIRIGGKADGYSPEDNALIEVKTLGLGSLRYERPDFLNRYEVDTEFGKIHDVTRLWRDFRRPLPSAVRQTQLYMYLAIHFEDLEVDRCIFFYDFKSTQETKSFTVMYDESFSEPLIEAAAAITDCVAADTPPHCNLNGRTGCVACLEYKEHPGDPRKR
jgi:rubrerythrin